MLTRLRPNVSSRSPLTPVLALTWLLLGFAAAPALAANPAAPAADRPGTGPALRVEDRTVSRDEYRRKVRTQVRRMRRRLAQMARLRGDTSQAASPPDTAQLRRRVRRQVQKQEIVRLLLEIHAERANVTVSDSEVEQQWQGLVERVGSEEALRQKLGEIGREPGELRRQLRTNLRIQRFVESRVPEPTVSDSEVRRFYRQNEDQLGERTLEEIRPQIQQQIRRRKQRRATRRLIRTLREQSDVSVNV